MVVTAGTTPATWIVVGASRGIGLEFARQLLSHEKQVIAVVRDPDTASQLWQVVAGQERPGSCVIEQCDVRKENDIEAFISRIKILVDGGLNVEGVVLNSGILKYPNRATEISFSEFADHLHTNTIGPIVIARKLLNNYKPSSPRSSSAEPTILLPPSKVIFISSDSGSMVDFRDFEDGFAAYAASKAALNMMVRHMAVELKRRGDIWGDIVVGCLHPGEVATDMGSIEVDWEVEGIISAEESVAGMLKVIASRGKSDSGGFWCWNGKVGASILRNTHFIYIHVSLNNKVLKLIAEAVSKGSPMVAPYQLQLPPAVEHPEKWRKVGRWST